MSLREQLEAGMRAAKTHTADGRHLVSLGLHDGVMVSMQGAKSSWHRAIPFEALERDVENGGVIARTIIEGAEALG